MKALFKHIVKQHFHRVEQFLYFSRNISMDSSPPDDNNATPRDATNLAPCPIAPKDRIPCRRYTLTLIW